MDLCLERTALIVTIRHALTCWSGDAFLFHVKQIFIQRRSCMSSLQIGDPEHFKKQQHRLTKIVTKKFVSSLKSEN